jgi:uncharacterized radical SAM superfamily protein
MAFAVYEPGKAFPAVSVTGAYCGMSCAHCAGRYLAGMADVSADGGLWRFARTLASEGGEGILVSGGCDGRGTVPLLPHFATMRRIRHELGLVLNVHVGLLDEGLLAGLVEVEPDAVSVDVVGSDAVVREVFGLERTADDYWTAYERLRGAGLSAVPHLTIGLSGWGDSDERGAIARLAESTPEKLVLNLMIPTRGTRFEGRRVDTAMALDVISLARDSLPRAFIVLGCMRPRGDSGFELEAVERGIDGMVNPARGTLEGLRRIGKSTVIRRKCCALGEQSTRARTP